MAAAAGVAAPTQPPPPPSTIAGPNEDLKEDSAVPVTAPQPDPATPAQQFAKGKGLRTLRELLPLRRAFSPKLKHASLSSPTLLSPVSPVIDTDDESPATAKPRTRLTAFERFVNVKLGARKVSKKPKGPTEDSRSEDAAIALDLDPALSDSSAPSTPGGEQVLPAIPESSASATDAPAAAEDPAAPPDGGDPEPEPLSLARKIQSLLSSFPPFLTPLSSASQPPSNTDPDDGPADAPKKKEPDGGADPSAPSTIDNSRLVSLLSSPSIMNGSLSRGRQSVWALLDNLRLKSLTSPSSDSPVSTADGTATGVGTDSDDSNDGAQSPVTVEDDDSVMFYGPLVPDATSEVELARSEIVSVDENGTIVDVLLDDAPLPAAPMPQARFAGLWPFSSGATSTSAPAKPKVLVEKRVWVPSTTKLSLQVMWWGYRLWLPPPVMNLLNDKEIEAAKLGAMLTAALQWLLNNVPASALPPTLQPALALVRSLVPYLGYIGGFVAWSWSAIRGFDVGNGVTLTATWLLPIALIPGTWENNDVPQPQPQPPSTGNPVSSPSAPSSGGSSAPPSGPGSDPSSSASSPSPASPTPPSGNAAPSGSGAMKSPAVAPAPPASSAPTA
ncbi:hypothetical protein BD414DRAFT_236854 [Trametes punicea]|nr:hypothetical protein BD414DRAFT_236854 [Trametes punicea]